MKKIIFMFAAFVALTFASCNNGSAKKSVVTTDSTSVDSTDTAVADTDSACND